MGTLHNKHIPEDKKSISSVLNLSLNSNKEFKEELISNEDNISDINELKNIINIEIENENIESNEFILEGKENDIKIKNYFENELDEELIHKKRSKTFVPIISYKNAPRPHPKESNEYISPLKLSIKSFCNISKWNMKPNSVLYEFQKDIIECKSCNDSIDNDDYYIYNSETERTTPNVEDLQDLLNCRKKMSIFRDSIDERSFKEYENILNSDYIFDEKKDINNNHNHHQKKNKFWNKYIKQQKIKDKHKIHKDRILSAPFVETYDEEKDKKDSGLFILGILESAAHEKKGRNTVNV
jgi:hypothetical protein